MEIDPYLQFRLLLAAFSAGIFAGMLWDLLTVSRILFGAYQAPPRLRALYERRLPLLGCSVPFEGQKAVRRAWRTAVLFGGDLLFCVAFALAVILVLYCLNGGIFRISVPVLSLIGFALFRAVSNRLFSGAVAYFAFGVAALRLYIKALLLLPVRGLLRFVRLAVLRPVARVYKKIAARHATRVSDRLCRAQLLWASKEFEIRKDEGKYVEKNRGQTDTSAMDGSHTHPRHLRRGGAHRRGKVNGVEL